MDWDGTQFPPDDGRPLCSLYHNRLIIAVDWTTARDKKLDESALDPQNIIVGGVGSGVLGPKSEITLADCLQSYSCDELFDENSWYCGVCKAHRQGTMKAYFYKLPDILVIHIKRFNMSARWREKIRTKVIFPIDGLDMAQYTIDGNGERDTSVDSSSLYDLYAVINHIGGMSGGHYNAAVRYYGHARDSASLASPPQSVKPRADDDEKSASGTEETATTANESKTDYRSSLAPPNTKKIRGIFSCVSAVPTNVAQADLTEEDLFRAKSHVGQWFLIDDDSSVPIEEASVVTANAYVLFYRRRVLSNSSGKANF